MAGYAGGWVTYRRDAGMNIGMHMDTDIDILSGSMASSIFFVTQWCRIVHGVTKDYRRWKGNACSEFTCRDTIGVVSR